MELYPAVDSRGGSLVRSLDRSNPVDIARAYVENGASWIHVVDLDAVFGTGDNLDRVCEVCGVAGVRVQVGGNLDDPRRIRAVVAAGADRVVFGTMPSLDPNTLTTLKDAAGPAAVAVALEICGAKVYLRGAGRTIDDPTPAQFVDLVREHGVDTLVYRDVQRDGSLAGADLEGASGVVSRDVSVIYAGGVESIDDILCAREVGVDGVVIGRALLENRFSLEEALACLG
jgi:phosphoribosylformimino-5-aminoimidazole carboxamide ribonucleotide (ProFAR) isomerase